MPIETRQRGTRLRRLAVATVYYAWVALPWGSFAWLGSVIACRRWTGWELAVSLSACAAAAAQGCRLVWRIARKLDDAQIARLLLQVEDAPEWAIFPHPAQALKAAHLSRCSQWWGVTPRSSGWEPFCRSWRRDVAAALGCLAVSVHPWWLGL